MVLVINLPNTTKYNGIDWAGYKLIIGLQILTDYSDLN